MSGFFIKIWRFFLEIGRFFWQICDDLMFFGGLAVIVRTNFQVNELLGWYSLGLGLMLGGILAARAMRKGAVK